MFDSRADRTARPEGAETAATTGIPASQGLLHDLERCAAGHHQHMLGERQSSVERDAPDELVDRIVAADVLAQELQVARPPASNRAAACRPPVRSNTRWPERSDPDSAASTSRARPRAHPERGEAASLTASMLALPQMPHEEVA